MLYIYCTSYIIRYTVESPFLLTSIFVLTFVSHVLTHIIIEHMLAHAHLFTFTEVDRSRQVTFIEVRLYFGNLIF